MTREEIIQGLYRGDSKAIKEAIKKLEQEPCEDAISRKEAIDTMKHWFSDMLETGKERNSIGDVLNSLPPVTPAPKKCHNALKQESCEDAISRKEAKKLAWDLELETCYDNERVVEMLDDLPPVTPAPKKCHNENHDYVTQTENIQEMNKRCNTVKNAREHIKTIYVLFKDDEYKVFNTEKSACEFLGVRKSSVSDSWRRKCKCNGWNVVRIGNKLKIGLGEDERALEYANEDTMMSAT